jgi:hypothetical protein
VGTESLNIRGELPLHVVQLIHHRGDIAYIVAIQSYLLTIVNDPIYEVYSDVTLCCAGLFPRVARLVGRAETKD